MSVLASFTGGLRRVRRAPWLVCGVWLATLLVAVPLAALLDGMLAAHLGSSLAAETAAEGANLDWWNEFLAQASGIGQSWVPAIIGFAAVLENLSDLADAHGLSLAIGMAVGAHLLLSTFLLGGVLDRLARDRATRSGPFFGACGLFFFRFLRLAVIAGAVYAFLFVTVHRWLFDGLYESWTRDVTVERTAFAVRVAGYAVFGALVLAVNLVFDYAKIRAVVEDRRSMLGALAASLRFLRRHAAAAVALYALNTALFLIVLALYAVTAPSAATPTLAALFIGQLYIVLRIVVRLQFAASQTAFFQGRLAHAAYTAPAIDRWPDSPAVEALRRDELAAGGGTR